MCGNAEPHPAHQSPGMWCEGRTTSLAEVDAAWPSAHDKAVLEADYFRREGLAEDDDFVPLRDLAEAYLALRALVESDDAPWEPCPACNHDASHTPGRGCADCECGCVFLTSPARGSS